MKEYKENNKKIEIDGGNQVDFGAKKEEIVEKKREKNSEGARLFEAKKEFSAKEIREIGDYPLLKTLEILKYPDEETIKKLEEKVLIEAASAVSLDGRKLRVKDVNAFGPLLVQMLKEGSEKGALEINKNILESLLLKSGYKSLDEFLPEKQKELETLRTLCLTLVENRDLLDRCLKPFPKCGWTLKNHLPLLVKDVALRTGLNLSEEEIQNLADSFVNIKNLAESKECQAILNYYDSDDPCWDHDGRRKNLYGILCEYANSYFQTEYLVDILYKVKEVIKLYYPDIFKDLPAKTSIQYRPIFHYDIEKKYCIGEATENAAYSKETSHLKVFSMIPLNNRRNYGKMEIINSFDIAAAKENKEKAIEIPRILRKNSDLMSLIHEYLHYLVVEQSNLPDDFLTNEGALSKKYRNSPYVTMLEGTSVFLELLIEDFLTKDALKLGLTNRDIEDLKNLKDGRLRSLKEHGRGLRHLQQKIEIMENPQEREQLIRAWEEEKQELEKARPAGVNPKDYSGQSKIQELEKLIERAKDPVKVQSYIKRLRQEILDYNAYYEGTLSFFHKLYKKEGLTGTLNFIKNLDAEKILKVDRESEEYKELLGNPDLFVEKFTRAPEQSSPKDNKLPTGQAVRGFAK